MTDKEPPKDWEVKDGEVIVIRDASGTKRFVGDKDALMRSYVWIMQEYDRIREEMTRLPSRIEAALRSYDDDQKMDRQAIADKEWVTQFYTNIEKRYGPHVASKVARQQYIAHLLRRALNPLQRSAENRLTLAEAEQADHVCPSCRFISFNPNPALNSCLVCMKQGYECCINRETNLCYECEDR